MRLRKRLPNSGSTIKPAKSNIGTVIKNVPTTFTPASQFHQDFKKITYDKRQHLANSSAPTLRDKYGIPLDMGVYYTLDVIQCQVSEVFGYSVMEESHSMLGPIGVELLKVLNVCGDLLEKKEAKQKQQRPGPKPNSGPGPGPA